MDLVLTLLILFFIIGCLIRYIDKKEDVMGDLSRLQEEVGKWSRVNFPNNEPYMPLLGVGEEYGELCHAHLKNVQRIRGMHDDAYRLKAMDAVGDIIIYLADYCERADLDLETCVFNTWDLVKQRNWKERPQDG